MESRQPDIYVACSITLFASTAALILRLIARRTTKFKLWWDDYFAIAAWVFATVGTIWVLFWVPLGLGLHLEDVAPLRHEPTNGTISHSLLCLWISDYLYSFSLGFTKISILCFYWRIFGHCRTKLGIQTLSVMSVMWICMRLILTTIQCIPVNAYWDLTITDKYCPIQSNKFFTGSVITHLFIEFSIIILPVRKLWQLQLPTAQKIGIGAVFMSGIFICATSVVQLVTVLTHSASSTDLTWDLAPIIAWGVVEINLASFAISLPMLRPIYVVYIRQKPLSAMASHGDHMSRSGRSAIPHRSADRPRVRDVDEGDSTYELTSDITRSDYECHIADDKQDGIAKIVVR
ncbi:hypothetical protein BKA66DRAFT_545098 [Pyrenochaeta sp. MPI-SDFR-AT-0127]|nr:hypothetical protein BKA66DRAFT_545098 [Pyrenochaeta sp. MPI-SDFR-AT-0127]